MNKTDTSIPASSLSATDLAVKEIRRPVPHLNSNGFLKNAHNIENQTNGRVLLASPALENQLLSSLDRSNLTNLLPFMERVSFSSDEYLFFPEKSPRYVYFPESVVVSEIQILEDGRTVEIAMTGRESAIGLPSVFGHRQAAATWMQTTIKGSALRIGVETLRDEFGRSEPFRKICFEHINDHIRHISRRVSCYSFHSVRERLCTWLLMLHNRKNDGRFQLTHEKIARLLGVHRPSVTLITKKLREENVLEYSRARICIIDRQKLKRYACSCYSG